MTDCRLIIDSPKPGDENMAIDESLLVSAATNPAPTLRFYRWSEPTLSLGYFQAHADREAHLPSQACTLVRRHSGGGAIVHNHELTYSLIVPVSDRWSAKADDLYLQVHRSIIDSYRDCGVTATLAADGEKQAFLCFLRRSDGDILIDEHKVTGSAQRRHRGALLQHGSMLISKSDFAPELPGLKELGATDVDERFLVTTTAENIAAALSLRLIPEELTKQEAERAATIRGEKFGNKKWTFRR